MSSRSSCAGRDRTDARDLSMLARAFPASTNESRGPRCRGGAGKISPIDARSAALSRASVSARQERHLTGGTSLCRMRALQPISPSAERPTWTSVQASAVICTRSTSLTLSSRPRTLKALAGHVCATVPGWIRRHERSSTLPNSTRRPPFERGADWHAHPHRRIAERFARSRGRRLRPAAPQAAAPTVVEHAHDRARTAGSPDVARSKSVPDCRQRASLVGNKPRRRKGLIRRSAHGRASCDPTPAPAAGSRRETAAPRPGVPRHLTSSPTCSTITTLRAWPADRCSCAMPSSRSRRGGRDAPGDEGGVRADRSRAGRDAKGLAATVEHPCVDYRNALDVHVTAARTAQPDHPTHEESDALPFLQRVMSVEEYTECEKPPPAATHSGCCRSWWCGPSTAFPTTPPPASSPRPVRVAAWHCGYTAPPSPAASSEQFGYV